VTKELKEQSAVLVSWREPRDGIPGKSKTDCRASQVSWPTAFTSPAASELVPCC